MIDIELYRCRIGIFCGGGGCGKGNNFNFKNTAQDFSVFSPTNNLHSTKFYRLNTSTMKMEENIVHSDRHTTTNIMYTLLYFYFIMLFTIISLSFLCSPMHSINSLHHLYSGVVYLNWDLSFIAISHIKVAYVYLVSYVLLRSICNGKNYWNNALIIPRKCTRLVRVLSNLILSLLVLNFLLIGIINPSLLNQGPNNLNVYYQNVHGLIVIPFLSYQHYNPNWT